jgi:putative restriction endonuclease
MPTDHFPETAPPIDVEAQDFSDDELEKAILQDRARFPGEIATSSTVAESRRPQGQAKLRELTLQNYGSTCALCEVDDARLLVTSHIVGWGERVETRGLLSNAICLCRFHDALFESGYWSLTDDLRVVRRSPIDSATIQALLPPTGSLRLPTSHPPAAEFARHHRARHGL